MKTISTIAFVSVALSCVCPVLAALQYNIVKLGLDDLEHTRNDGFKFSVGERLNDAGQISGYSERYNDAGGRSAWLFDGTATINTGLEGSEYTRSDGYKYSTSQQLNGAGQVRGYSERYIGGVARIAWLYDGATTIDIGLTDSVHTRNDGYRFSGAAHLNGAGRVSGSSRRYYNNTEMGQTAWLYDGATTIDIGLTDSEHSRHDGYRYSNVNSQLNETGQVLGYSKRYSGSLNMGQTAWIYDGANSIAIGLTDTEHTRISGYRNSFAGELNEAGQVRGHSDRYNGGSIEKGQSAWFFDGAATINIGLVGSEHTRNDGRKVSYTQDMNEAGQVLGSSSRYNGGSTHMGESTWLYDGSTTVDIGLIGDEHTGFGGYKDSRAEQLNEAGQVIGYSHRFGGVYDYANKWLGLDAWLYDGVTTTAIGLTSPEFTRNDRYRESAPHSLNEAGHVIGYTNRYNGGVTELGPVAWFYDGVSTSAIGLTGPAYTRTDGYNFDVAYLLNEAGQASGFSYRYYGGSIQLGQDAWFYDPILDQTHSLQLSVRSDGYAYSSVAYLGEDGLVLGTYTLFDAQDNELGLRAFYFTIADGLHHLGTFVDGGLSANGWDFLADAIRGNGRGQILGHGKLTSQSGGQVAYLLTPVIPEPSALLLAALGTLGLLARRRFRVARTKVRTPR